MEQNLEQNSYRIEAVDRAMVLLTLLVERESLSVTEAAASLGVAPSTAHRLLTTMAGRGFVEQGERKLYHPGPQLLGARAPQRSIPALVARMRPVLQALHDEVRETVHLVVLAGPDVQFVYGIEGQQTLRIGLRIGSRIPAYCTSGGKAILAALPADVVDGLHPEGLRPWPGRHAESLADLHAELDRVRRRGYGVNTEESELGVAAVGVAVGADAAQPAGAVSISLPTARYDPDDEARLVAPLRVAQDEAVRILAG
ncbi:IclR family transcriptional regulator [Promicromonospora vindobonensis]|uniref:IclR family transcriptional regulator n=1 Tax=Promicromonospora vindobonensis TaxID=195748 RepID=A0ABW5VUF8_9MICO